MVNKGKLISEFMSKDPYVLSAETTVAEARKLMSELSIRHFPVLKQNQLFGVLTDRDVKLALSFSAIDLYKTTVGEICRKKPYHVDPDTRLSEVVKEMEKNAYGSTIITQNDKVIGIFTTVDACRILSEML